MKRTLRCVLAAFLSALMLFTIPGSVVGLADNEGEEIFLEDSICFPDDGSLGAGEAAEGGQTELFQIDCPEGEPEPDSPGALSSPLDGEEETIGADDEEIFPENASCGLSGMDDTLGSGSGDDETLGASPKVTASKTTLTLTKGDTGSVTMTASGFSGSVYLQYSTNNTKSFSCTWGSWNKLKIPLKIKANAAGTGTVTVYMKSASNNKTLSSVKIKVTVKAKTPTLTLSSSSVNIAAGTSQKVNVTIKDCSEACYLKYVNSNGSAVRCAWGSWSGMTIPITITGNSAGKGTVTIYLCSSSGRQLAQASISVSIYKLNPKVTLSATSVSLKVGKSTTVRVTPSNFSGECTLSVSQTNTSAFSCAWGSWSNGSISLTITGKNQGSGSATVYLKSKNGTVLASATISTIQVTAEKKPEIKASTGTVSISAGKSQAIEISYSNCSESVFLQYSTTNSTAYQCLWGNWNGNRIPLTITGKSAGSGRVTVYLKRARDSATLASVQINASIAGLTIHDVGFGFHNYSNYNISYELCKYMFGDNQKARAMFNSHIGNGGVCFGFATGATMLDVTSAPPQVGSFSGGRASISQLRQTDRSSSYGLSVTDYIEAMHITQKATEMTFAYGLDSLVSTVKSQTDAGRPVVICLWGRYAGSPAGHAIVAFGYNQVSSTECRIRIYDCNYAYSSSNMTETTLYARKSYSSGPYESWSYNLTGSVTWGTGYSGSDIAYIPYDTIIGVWNRRGSLSLKNMNLVSTLEDNFSVYDFEDHLVARYADGEMVQKADNVIELPNFSFNPDGNADQANMFYAPVDLYTVQDDSPDTPMEMILSDDLLSVKLTTDADRFDLCADDQSNSVNALLTPEEGSQYTVSLSTLVDGNLEEIRIEGVGTGETVSLGLQNGALSIIGADSAELSIFTIGDSFSIEADCTAGGTISGKGTVDYPSGMNVRYQIKADEGYKIRAVLVDGEDIGPVDEYYFENIEASHTITAFFCRDISLCTVQLSDSEYWFTGKGVEPEVTVLDADGSALTRDLDYTVSYENNVAAGNALIYITALEESNYYGVATAAFEIRQPEFGEPDFTLPGNLTELGESALEGTAAHTVFIPDSCGSIGEYAFRDSQVIQVRIPENCTIADNAFDGCEMVLLYGMPNGSAEAYCNGHENCMFVPETQ